MEGWDLQGHKLDFIFPIAGGKAGVCFVCLFSVIIVFYSTKPYKAKQSLEFHLQGS